MTNLPSKTLCCAAGAALVTLACASNPPRELLDARAVYGRLATTDAPKLTPNAVGDARIALAAAEEAYETGAPAYLVRDRAYISVRASEYVQVVAASERERIEHQEALARRSGSAAEVRKRLAAAEQDQVEQAHVDERMAPLAPSVVSVKDEPRGTVLTVPAQMLFLPGSADFLPGTPTRLEPVAEALKEETESKILVEPGAPVDGSLTPNLGLALRRADHVRDFLVSHDVSPERVVVADAQATASSPPSTSSGTSTIPIVVRLSPAS